jgi:hypothetical protein
MTAQAFDTLRAKLGEIIQAHAFFSDDDEVDLNNLMWV